VLFVDATKTDSVEGGHRDAGNAMRNAIPIVRIDERNQYSASVNVIFLLPAYQSLLQREQFLLAIGP
jgi:hypothetical protein